VQITHRGRGHKSLTDRGMAAGAAPRAVGPLIGHGESDHRMDRCAGSCRRDGRCALHAAGYNIRWLLRAIIRLNFRGGELYALSAYSHYLACLLR
jgi:IS5 family transposase